MRELVIGDLHFGSKANSTEWLNLQCRFIEKQVFDTIDNYDIDRIVFLGDLTDVRYSINQQVGIELKNTIKRLSQKFANKNADGKIIFIAGNHDFYSPLEEYNDYNSYRLLLDECIIKEYNNIIIVDKTPLLLDDTLFLPWYWTEDNDHFDELLYRYDFKSEVKAIYCHADLCVWPGARINALRGCPVYAGHIHYIYDDPIGNLHNLGAALQLTFADTNQERYIYIIENHKVVDKIVNNTTPQFKRIYNNDIFNVDESLFKNSYVQICISKSNINKANYIEQLKNIKTSFIDANIRIHIIDEEDADLLNTAYINDTAFNTNISDYIENNIPIYLNDKYEMIKQKMTE